MARHYPELTVPIMIDLVEKMAAAVNVKISRKFKNDPEVMYLYPASQMGVVWKSLYHLEEGLEPLRRALEEDKTKEMLTKYKELESKCRKLITVEKKLKDNIAKLECPGLVLLREYE